MRMLESVSCLDSFNVSTIIYPALSIYSATI